jgi:hypothetical protein
VLKQVNGKWALVSRKTQRPLAYYKGEGKPSDEWVKKQEARIQMFKAMNEQQEFVSKAGAGEWGRPELTKKYINDTPGQKIKKFKNYIKNT